MRRLRAPVIMMVAQLVATTANAGTPDETAGSTAGEPVVPAADPVASATPASRALPIGMLTIGVPLLTVGAIAIAIDADDSAQAPTYRDSARIGVASLVSGGVVTAIGTWLYLRRPVTAPNAHPALKWSGVVLLAGAAVSGALLFKYQHDYNAALDEAAPICDLNCADPRLPPIRDRRDRAYDRVDILVGATGVLAAGGVLLFLASREGGDSAPRVQVTGSAASIGWSTAF